MTLGPLRLEICVDSADGAWAAQAGGADRVELCDSMIEGGTTPSLGMLRSTRAAIGIELCVMIRPRGGDFHYSPREVEAMHVDIEAAKDAGAEGVVLGVLRADGTLDEPCLAEFVATARPMTVTFHRAFDMTRNPLEALDGLIRLGVDRVLTSGQEASAPLGLLLLRELVDRARDRIVVMPGCGIRSHNLTQVKNESGAHEFHASAWKLYSSSMVYRNERISMGGGSAPPEYERFQTSAAEVRALVSVLREDES
jgi:copper homeostasis protein